MTFVGGVSTKDIVKCQQNIAPVVMAPREGVAFAGDRSTVKFMVLCVMVVDKARFLLDPAAGRIFKRMAAGQPVTIRILEPVFYNGF